MVRKECKKDIRISKGLKAKVTGMSLTKFEIGKIYSCTTYCKNRTFLKVEIINDSTYRIADGSPQCRAKTLFFFIGQRAFMLDRHLEDITLAALRPVCLFLAEETVVGVETNIARRIFSQVKPQCGSNPKKIKQRL